MSASEIGHVTCSAAEVYAECFVGALFAQQASRVADAERALRRFTMAGGAVAFSSPAHFVTAAKR